MSKREFSDLMTNYPLLKEDLVPWGYSISVALFDKAFMI
jgi:hypothetical protein